MASISAIRFMAQVLSHWRVIVLIILWCIAHAETWDEVRKIFPSKELRCKRNEQGSLGYSGICNRNDSTLYQYDYASAVFVPIVIEREDVSYG